METPQTNPHFPFPEGSVWPLVKWRYFDDVRDSDDVWDSFERALDRHQSPNVKPDNPPRSYAGRYRNRGKGGAFHPRVPFHRGPKVPAPLDGWNMSRVQRLIRNLWGSSARTWTRTLTDPNAPGGTFVKHFAGIESGNGPVSLAEGVTWYELVTNVAKVYARKAEPETPTETAA